ncbi:hypothetical protein FN846DRAFT_891452 [Sphaerosporella brunnea]|uniref:Uncharacterized protein n=1 Tax=Sphaerosporella brunnea TaxID=1250544 RepID=A0A5J5ET78_9PEZI|nr:hypothetical protein FN846DRAFT_891452 [Sphaerosporella brunnea]
MRAYQLAALAAAFLGQLGHSAPATLPEADPEAAAQQRPGAHSYVSKYPNHPINLGYGDNYPKYWQNQAYNPADYPPRVPFYPAPYSTAWKPTNPGDGGVAIKVVDPEPASFYVPPHGFPSSKTPAKDAIEAYTAQAQRKEEQAALEAAAEEAERLRAEGAIAVAAAAAEEARHGPRKRSAGEPVIHYEQGPEKTTKNMRFLGGDEGSGDGASYTKVVNNPRPKPREENNANGQPDWQKFTYGVLNEAIEHHPGNERQEAGVPAERKTDAMGKVQKLIGSNGGGGTSWYDHLQKRGLEMDAALVKRDADADAQSADSWPDHIQQKAIKMMKSAASMQDRGQALMESDPAYGKAKMKDANAVPASAEEQIAEAVEEAEEAEAEAEAEEEAAIAAPPAQKRKTVPGKGAKGKGKKAPPAPAPEKKVGPKINKKEEDEDPLMRNELPERVESKKKPKAPKSPKQNSPPAQNTKTKPARGGKNKDQLQPDNMPQMQLNNSKKGKGNGGKGGKGKSPSVEKRDAITEPEPEAIAEPESEAVAAAQRNKAPAKAPAPKKSSPNKSGSTKATPKNSKFKPANGGNQPKNTRQFHQGGSGGKGKGKGKSVNSQSLGKRDAIPEPEPEATAEAVAEPEAAFNNGKAAAEKNNKQKDEKEKPQGNAAGRLRANKPGRPSMNQSRPKKGGAIGKGKGKAVSMESEIRPHFNEGYVEEIITEMCEFEYEDEGKEGEGEVVEGSLRKRQTVNRRVLPCGPPTTIRRVLGATPSTVAPIPAPPAVTCHDEAPAFDAPTRIHAASHDGNAQHDTSDLTYNQGAPAPAPSHGQAYHVDVVSEDHQSYPPKEHAPGQQYAPAPQHSLEYSSATQQYAPVPSVGPQHYYSAAPQHYASAPSQEYAPAPQHHVAESHVVEHHRVPESYAVGFPIPESYAFAFPVPAYSQEHAQHHAPQSHSADNQVAEKHSEQHHFVEHHVSEPQPVEMPAPAAPVYILPPAATTTVRQIVTQYVTVERTQEKTTTVRVELEKTTTIEVAIPGRTEMVSIDHLIEKPVTHVETVVSHAQPVTHTRHVTLPVVTHTKKVEIPVTKVFTKEIAYPVTSTEVVRETIYPEVRAIPREREIVREEEIVEEELVISEIEITTNVPVTRTCLVCPICDCEEAECECGTFDNEERKEHEGPAWGLEEVARNADAIEQMVRKVLPDEFAVVQAAAAAA